MEVAKQLADTHIRQQRQPAQVYQPAVGHRAQVFVVTGPTSTLSDSIVVRNIITMLLAVAGPGYLSKATTPGSGHPNGELVASLGPLLSGKLQVLCKPKGVAQCGLQLQSAWE